MRFLLAMLLLLATPVLAQQTGQPVQNLPNPRVVTNVSSTVAVTNTFQALLSANTGRLECTIQNTGTNAMYVFFGATADATVATSAKLTAGQSAYCTVNNVNYLGAVAITGTATETFYAVYQ